MRFNMKEDYVNMMSKKVYYILEKDAVSYQTWPFIFDTKFKSDEATTKAMAWISFSNLP